MEKIYKVENNELVFPSITGYNKMVPGEIYNLSYMLEEGSYSGVRQAYMYEKHSMNETHIVSDENGGTPFSVSTRDCARDKFPKDCIAQILLKEGQYVFRFIASKQDNGKVEKITYVMKIVEVFPNVEFQDKPVSINVEFCLAIRYPFVKGREIVGQYQEKFKQAFIHINRIHCIPFDPYFVPRYSFNPRRIITTRQFTQDVEGNLVSFTDKGKRLVLNQKSKLYYEKPNDPKSPKRKGAFIRCFYGRRAADEDIIYVDGAIVSMVQRADLPAYIEKSGIYNNYDNGLHQASLSIKEVYAIDGLVYYAMVVDSDGGMFLPLCKSIDGFNTIQLNEKEGTFISEYKDLQFVLRDGK
jgi:hypothetical protein